MPEVVHAEILQQWRMDAPLSAVEIGADMIAAGVQYADCNVLRVYKKNPIALPEDPAQEDPLPPQSKLPQHVDLHGHSDRISCIRMYSSDSARTTLIASSSSDCILVWSWPSSSSSSSPQDIRELTSRVLRQKPSISDCSCMAFDATGTVLALAMDKQVELVQVHSGATIVTLQGHLAKVTKCVFHPMHPHVIVTASEDRTFKIWDLQAKSLVFQSAVLSAFSIVALSFNEVTGDISVGFADGTLKIFALQDHRQLTDNNSSSIFFARELVSLNVAKFMDKRRARQLQQQEALRSESCSSPRVISSLPSWARKDKANQDVIASDVNASAETSCSILSLQYLCCIPIQATSCSSFRSRQFNSHQDKLLKDTHQFLLVGLPNHLVVVNAFTYEPSVLVDFQHQQDMSSTSSSTTNDRVQIARDFSFCVDPAIGLLTCGVVSAFQPLLTQFCIGLVASSRSPEVEEDRGVQHGDPRSSAHLADDYEHLSILPQRPPPQDSILMAPSKLLRSPDSKKPGTGKLVDKPVTFHSRIKSSGYGSTLPFSLQQKKKKQTIQQRKTANRDSSASSLPSFLKEYPVDCDLMEHFQPQHALPRQTLHHGAIHWIEYSSDAKSLATAGNDQVAQTCRLPFARFRGGNANVLTGHNGAVKSIRFSHSNQLLLTTSMDQTAKLWSINARRNSLDGGGGTSNNSSIRADLCHNVKCCLTLSARDKATDKKVASAGDIVDARFFYLDKFLLVTSGNAMQLFEYDQTKAMRCASTNSNGTISKSKTFRTIVAAQSPTGPLQSVRKQKVFTYECPGMQQITCVTCVNGLLSQVIVAGGSDRSIRIVDACYGQTLRQIPEAHARAPHTLVLPTPSCFVSHPGNFYDLLLSSAANSTIHLWDIRADNCVMRFSEHVNRTHPVGVAFSPCMRYIATGSEDRSGYLYDLRTGRCLRRLGGHGDVVTCVAFNPLYPQLATASYDSTVRFYSDSGA